MSIVPSQILYLEHGPARLYAEAIQIVESRALCWARPTLLIKGLQADASIASRQEAIAAAAAAPLQSQLHLHDLKDCSDLIWPLELFQIAFDIDFFSLLAQLRTSPRESPLSDARHQLNEFIRGVWQDHVHTFPPALKSESRDPPASDLLLWK